MPTYRINRPGHPSHNTYITHLIAPEPIGSGAVGEFAYYVESDPPLPPEADVLTDLLQQRNNKLAASDWTQMPDVPLTDEQVTAWREYRQALRDWPETVTDPWNPPPFPKPPAA
jgi:hypothetical protein